MIPGDEPCIESTTNDYRFEAMCRQVLSMFERNSKRTLCRVANVAPLARSTIGERRSLIFGEGIVAANPKAIGPPTP